MPQTHLNYNGKQTNPDLLLVSSDISDQTTRTILDDLGTDHRPMIATICYNDQKNAESNKSKISWNFKKANWEKYTKVLENNLQSGNMDFNQSTADIGKYAKAYIPRGRVKGYKCFWNKDLEANGT